MPTEQRVTFGAANQMRDRSAHIDAVLGEAGWQVEPGDALNPLCDAARVGAEPGIAATTARRWMRDQVIPSAVNTDDFGNPRRRARLLDVQAVRERLGSRTLLRDVAAGVGYHLAWHAMQRLGLSPFRDARTDELILNGEQNELLRAEFERLAALKARSIRLSSAATRMGVAISTVKRFVQAGELQEGPETDPSGARYVTLASVDALIASRARRSPPAIRTDVVSLAAVARVTGLSQGQISELTLRRVLERSDIGRRFHVTTPSLRRWAIGYRPDLISKIESTLVNPSALDDSDSNREEQPGR